MTAKFHALTDADLVGISHEDLLARYCDLRAHHIAETEALTKRDRSALLRMAGNIAGGICADPDFAGDVAKAAVRLAREIVAEADR